MTNGQGTGKNEDFLFLHLLLLERKIPLSGVLRHKEVRYIEVPLY